MAAPRPRVVVTGVGVVSPFGTGRERLMDGLFHGRPAVRALTDLPAEAPVRIAAVVPDFDPERHMDRRSVRRSGRFTHFSIAAAREALEMAGGAQAFDPDRVGVVIGTAGGLFWGGEQEQVLAERGPRRVDPLYLSRHAAYMAAVRLAMELGVRGPATTVGSACASGLDALGTALGKLRGGEADLILAGGSEAIVRPLGLAVLGLLGALSQRNDDPARASRPFDRDRDGFVLGEGAGILALEREEHALARGAAVLAELAGAGWSFDAHDDTAPDAAGQALAMRRALADADLAPEDLSWVKAHGTSTPLNDRTETQALRRALGAVADRVAVSSMKSMIGHGASASGGIEAVGAVLAMREGLIPPTINLEHPDPECDLDYVPNVARPARIRAVLLNAFGLGGQNACVVLRDAG
jgi:3-oxoacyl-[acyl-carrier-protein] synthase II